MAVPIFSKHLNLLGNLDKSVLVNSVIPKHRNLGFGYHTEYLAPVGANPAMLQSLSQPWSAILINRVITQHFLKRAWVDPVTSSELRRDNLEPRVPWRMVHSDTFYQSDHLQLLLDSYSLSGRQTGFAFMLLLVLK